MSKQVKRSNKLDASDKAKLRSRLLAGERIPALAKEYGLSPSTVNYHYHMAKDGFSAKNQSRTVSAKNPKKPKFIDIPVALPSAKVAIVITESKNINQVLGELWK